MCIDERLDQGDTVSCSFVRSKRLRQRDDDGSQEDVEFELVDTVDEVEAAERTASYANTGPNATVHANTGDNASAKDKQMYRIAQLGYVRPR